MAAKPPARIPQGEMTDAWFGPLEALIESSELSEPTRKKMRDAMAAAKDQRILLGSQIKALNQQVQALMAQFDWTLDRP